VLAWLCEDATNLAGEHIRYEYLRWEIVDVDGK